MSGDATGAAVGQIPRDADRDHSEAMAAERRRFVTEQTGARLDDVGRYSLDPASLAGNIENFLGVAQVPIGVAGPLHVRGEHAQGHFLIPLATTEGTLVASYNRGMRLLTENGGVTTTVVGDTMQRSPAFVCADARDACALWAWIEAHHDQIAAAAEATTSVGRVVRLDHHIVGPILFVRCNFTAGDAAGQNMTGKATLAACEWIAANHDGEFEFILSGNTDTDKKHSAMNTLYTRGKRVVAEAVLDGALLERRMGVSSDALFRWRQVSNVGAFMSGASNNGAHAANGIAAMFIATGQDAANVAESHAAITYSQRLENGDYYWSVTIPSLIVATYGGGTGGATQRECLEMMGCYGAGNVSKLAEIVAAVVLAGDISLSCAVLHGDWVSSHDRLGRNRP